MPRHIDGDDPVRLGKERDLRLPGLEPHADAMDQDKRLALAGFQIGFAAWGLRPPPDC
jgi:hypothetical protein